MPVPNSHVKRLIKFLFRSQPFSHRRRAATIVEMSSGKQLYNVYA